MKSFVAYNYSLLIVMSAVGVLLFGGVLQQYAFGLFWTVPTLFAVAALGDAVALKVGGNKDSRHALNWIFGAKLSKFIIAITYFVVYIKVVCEQNVAFAITFVAFYFVTLVVETIFFSKLLKSKHA